MFFTVDGSQSSEGRSSWEGPRDHGCPIPHAWSREDPVVYVTRRLSNVHSVNTLLSCFPSRMFYRFPYDFG